MDRLLLLQFVFALLLCSYSAGIRGEDFAAIRSQVASLGKLTTPPVFRTAGGFDENNPLRAVYFDAMPYQDKPTRVFAWLGFPAKEKLQDPRSRFPGVVLVHGGGGSAFKEWVQKWNDKGFVAISIAVEGQTDTREPETGQWQRHRWAGPSRSGIYGDSDKPLTDQWIYHAVADTILANSLLRSLPGVDAGKVGLMGISWGGVITSTVIGIDQRFAFAVPTYGCGNLASADNQYGRALGSNEMYQQVWDPMLRLQNATMPTLWLSWPGDQHFPLDKQAACYRAMPGKTMVSLIPGMRHSHPAGWNPPDSYAFAESIVRDGMPWCRQAEATQQEDRVAVTFVSSKTLEDAVLVSTPDDGITGSRSWTESPAELMRQDQTWRVSATLPPATTAWFINVHSKGLTVSSEYMSVVAKAQPTIGKHLEASIDWHPR